MSSDGEEDANDDLRALHDHLAATGERPVERTASHYLGEAEAVVADALAVRGNAAVVQRRVAQARDLLSEVEETGDEVADDHVSAARECCRAILDAGD